jgi:crotonobetainyl-CoA:carnitine CoA-transferase CaiB-like acyl-CoA transferase
MGVLAEWEVLGFEREAIGNYSFHTYANAFQVKDGWVMVNVIGNGCWRRFTKAVGMEDVASDPRFSDDETRFRNRELITAIVAQWMAQRTAQEVLEVLKGARVPCAQVMRISQVMRDPHLRERKTIAEVEHGRWGKVPVPGPIPRFSRIQERRPHPGPSPGQHNREIYGEVLGLSAEEMEVLRREGVI